MVHWLVATALLTAAPPVEVVTLSNGMRWLLLPRPDRGQVAGVVAIHAGSVNEGEGYTGAAHLLEHLAFAGTPLIGARHGWRLEVPLQERVFGLIDAHTRLDRRGEGDSFAARQLLTELVAAERDWSLLGNEDGFFDLMNEHDVRINASTDKDITLYWGGFPKEQLHFWLGAEAQRFAAPVFREFRKERGVVTQEWVDRRIPLSPAFDDLLSLAFNGTGYAWATVGKEADLRSLSPRDVERFYEEHYAPGNAVGCLVGEFDPAEAKQWLEQTFALIPNRPTVPLPSVTLAPPRTLTRRAAEGAVVLGFETPPLFSVASPAFELAQELLRIDDGPLRRLTGTAGSCSALAVAAFPGLAQRHLTIVSLSLKKGHGVAEARAGFFDALRTWTIDDELLEEARARLELRRLGALGSPRKLAETLASRQLLAGDARSAFEARYRSTPKEAVAAVLAGFTDDSPTRRSSSCRCWCDVGGQKSPSERPG